MRVLRNPERGRAGVVKLHRINVKNCLQSRVLSFTTTNIGSDVHIGEYLTLYKLAVLISLAVYTRRKTKMLAMGTPPGNSKGH